MRQEEDLELPFSEDGPEWQTGVADHLTTSPWGEYTNSRDGTLVFQDIVHKWGISLVPNPEVPKRENWEGGQTEKGGSVGWG